MVLLENKDTVGRCLFPTERSVVHLGRVGAHGAEVLRSRKRGLQIGGPAHFAVIDALGERDAVCEELDHTGR